MLDILLNFLGINSWYYNFLPIKKNKLNTEVKSYNRNLKTINILHLLKSDTPSPKTSIYIFALLILLQALKRLIEIK